MKELSARFPPDLEYVYTLDNTLPVSEGIKEIWGGERDVGLQESLIARRRVAGRFPLAAGQPPNRGDRHHEILHPPRSSHLPLDDQCVLERDG